MDDEILNFNINNNISYTIKKAFEYYDNKNEKYKNFIKNKKYIIDGDKSIIEIDGKKFNYQALGIFDNNTNVWLWSWMIPSTDNVKTKIAKKLLDYGLKLNVKGNDYDMLYIKTQLTNSRFLLENNLQLDIHLAISCYLIRDEILFLYPVKNYLDKEKTKYFTSYYMIIK